MVCLHHERRTRLFAVRIDDGFHITAHARNRFRWGTVSWLEDDIGSIHHADNLCSGRGGAQAGLFNLFYFHVSKHNSILYETRDVLMYLALLPNTGGKCVTRVWPQWTDRTVDAFVLSRREPAAGKQKRQEFQLRIWAFWCAFLARMDTKSGAKYTWLPWKSTKTAAFGAKISIRPQDHHFALTERNLE